MVDKVIKSRLRRMPDVLQIADGNGGEARLLGTGVIEYLCNDCHVVWWMKSNSAASCPGCRSTKNIYSRWTTPMVAFIPQLVE